MFPMRFGWVPLGLFTIRCHEATQMINQFCFHLLLSKVEKSLTRRHGWRQAVAFFRGDLLNLFQRPTWLQHRTNKSQLISDSCCASLWLLRLGWHHNNIAALILMHVVCPLAFCGSNQILYRNTEMLTVSIKCQIFKQGLVWDVQCCLSNTTCPRQFTRWETCSRPEGNWKLTWPVLKCDSGGLVGNLTVDLASRQSSWASAEGR